jgi:hypothetical protein
MRRAPVSDTWAMAGGAVVGLLHVRRSPDPRPAIAKAAAWSGAVRVAVAALAILVVLVPSPAAGQVVRGRVIDAQSGAAVELARVVVTGSGQRTRRTVTAADGRFSVRLRRGGTVRVQVARTGYAETRTRALTVGPHDTVDVVVRLSATALRLDSVTVTARARRLKTVGIFYETLDSVNARVHVVGQSRSVRARGSFPTPNRCYQLSGNADRTQNIITLTVQARGRSDLCVAETGGFVYDVTVRRLPPGTYTVRVLHAFQDGVREPAMVRDTTVTVR